MRNTLLIIGSLIVSLLMVELASRLADLYNLEYLDLLPSVQGQDPASLWVTIPDPHPNSYANKLFADYLVDPIAKQLQSVPGRSN